MSGIPPVSFQHVVLTPVEHEALRSLGLRLEGAFGAMALSSQNLIAMPKLFREVLGRCVEQEAFARGWDRRQRERLRALAVLFLCANKTPLRDILGETPEVPEPVEARPYIPPPPV